jgi:hypothetical protein
MLAIKQMISLLFLKTHISLKSVIIGGIAFVNEQMHLNFENLGLNLDG